MKKTRKEALAAGEVYYFTGEQCVNGHKSKRTVANWTCAECVRLGKKAGYDRRPEHYLAKNKAYAATESGQRKKAESDRNWQRNNKDRVKSRNKKWEQNNPLYVKAKNARRRARIIGSAGTYTKQDVLEMLLEQGGKCKYCPKRLDKYHVDHIRALSRGGSNGRENLQLLCPPCNLKKSNKLPVHFDFVRAAKC